jgi:putative acetyltransferase
VRIDVRQDRLSSAEVQLLFAEHLSGMHRNSPPGHVHALALENLRAPNVSFWTAWMNGILCGCGALKELGPLTGEVKSMRRRAIFLRRGVGQAILDEIFRTASRRRYSRLLGEHTATNLNLFMAKVLV